METETPTSTAVTVRTNTSNPDLFVIQGLTLPPQLSAPGRQGVKRAELQAIVQQAYDRHGIVAQLWTATPSANDTPQTSCNGTNHCAATSSHHFDCQAVGA